MKLMKHDVFCRDVFRSPVALSDVKFHVRRLIEHAIGVLTAY